MDLLNDIFSELKEYQIFNNVHQASGSPFLFSNDYNKYDKLIQNCVFELSGDLKMGYPKTLSILIRLVNNSEKFVEISGLGIFQKDNFIGYSSPIKYLFMPLDKESKKIKNIINRAGEPVINFNFNTIEMFKGNAELDSAFKNHIKNEMLKLINLSLEKVEGIVRSRIKDHKKYLDPSDVYFSNDSRKKEMIVIN